MNFVISDLNGEEIAGTFKKNELQKKKSWKSNKAKKARNDMLSGKTMVNWYLPKPYERSSKNVVDNDVVKKLSMINWS